MFFYFYVYDEMFSKNIKHSNVNLKCVNNRNETDSRATITNTSSQLFCSYNVKSTDGYSGYPVVEFVGVEKLSNNYKVYKMESGLKGAEITDTFNQYFGKEFLTNGFKFSIPYYSTIQNSINTKIGRYYFFEWDVSQPPATTVTVTKNLEQCNSDITTETIDKGEHTITINATNNYVFRDAPYITMNSLQYPFTLNENRTSGTITLNVTDDITITGTAVLGFVELDLRIEHCTCNYTGTTVPTGNITFRLQANQGYQFTKECIADSGYKTYPFTISPDKLTASVTFDVQYKVRIEATATKIPIFYSITQNLTNVTSDFTETTIQENSYLEIIYTALPDHVLVSASSTSGDIQLSADRNTATLRIRVTEDFTVTVNARHLYRAILNGTFKNCALKIGEEKYTEGEITIENHYRWLTLEANNDSFGFDEPYPTFTELGVEKTLYPLITPEPGFLPDYLVTPDIPGIKGDWIFNDTYEPIRQGLNHIFLTQNLTHVTSDYERTVVTINKTYTINLTPDENYLIETVTLTQQQGSPSENVPIGEITISDDRTTARVTFTTTDEHKTPITLTATANIIDTNSIPFTQNLTHVTSDYKLGTVSTNQTYNINLTPDEYYLFETITLKQGNVPIGKITISDDRTTAQVTFTTTEENKNPITLTATASISGNTVRVTQTLVGVSSSLKVRDVEKNSEHTVTITVDDPTTDILEFTCNLAQTNIASDRKSGTVTFVATEAVRIYATALPNSYVHITGTFTNCTCNYSDNEMINNQTKPDIIITANEGYEFREQFTYERNSITHPFTRYNSYLVAGLSKTEVGDVYLNKNYRAVKKVERIGTFANLYLTNNDELERLSRVRFVSVSADSIETVDYGDFINSLYVLPFPLPEELIGDRANISLGNYDSKVESTLINNYTLEVDLGSITVPEKFQNVYDYINTECKIHLPFLDIATLDSEYVINQTINIKYIIDLYSGNMNCNLYSTFIDDVFATFNANIVTQIPFLQKQNNSFINNLSNRFNNLVNTPFIEVTRNIPYHSFNIYGNEVHEYGQIKEYQGFLQADNVTIITQATQEEIDEIKELIKEGIFVYVNEENIDKM